MKILALHNYYQRPGGEDRVFASEAALLENHKHTVIRLSESNTSIGSGGLKAAGQAIWSFSSLQKVRRAVEEHKPDVIHAHNTFPLLSPSVYLAGREASVAVVQTLHNYRLLCPGATFMLQRRALRRVLGQPCHGPRHSPRLLPIQQIATAAVCHNADCPSRRRHLDPKRRFLCRTARFLQSKVCGG